MNMVTYGFIEELLRALLAKDSPSGHTEHVETLLLVILKNMGLTPQPCGHGWTVTLPHQRATPHLAILSHVDTLGARVGNKIDNSFGEPLHLIYPIGGLYGTGMLNARVHVHTEWAIMEGLIVPRFGGVHAYGELHEGIPVRKEFLGLRLLDETPAAAAGAGAQEGDLITFPTDLQTVYGGERLASRFLDSKADVAVMLTVILNVMRTGSVLPHAVTFGFNTQEEILTPLPLPAHITHALGVEWVPRECLPTAPWESVGTFWKDGAATSDPRLLARLHRLGRQCGIPMPPQVIVENFASDATLAKAKVHPNLNVATLGFLLAGSHGLESTSKAGLVNLHNLLLEVCQQGVA